MCAFALTAWASMHFGPVRAQQLGISGPSVVKGVRHEIAASLSFEANSMYEPANGEPFQADLRVEVRISDHAPDADFFGVMVGDFALSGTNRSAPEQIIWQDRKCHRDRGLPKVSITGIDGSVTLGEKRQEISAELRRVGKRLSRDEIVVRTVSGEAMAETARSSLAMRAVTKGSRILVDLKVRALECRL